MKKDKIRFIVFGGLCITLVFVATAIIPHIPVPFTEGYIHIGDSMIFVAAILFGWRYGAVAGGIGAAMSDLYLEYAHWALPTLIIKGIMGLIVGMIAHNSHKRKKHISAAISISVVGIWIGLSFWIKQMLSGILKNKEMTSLLMDTLDVNNVTELAKSINKVETIITIALISVPVIVVIISLIAKKNNKFVNANSMLGMSLAGIWMVIGYYFAGGILKGNMVIPIFSIPANILQFVMGTIIAYLIISALDKTNALKKVIK